MTRRPMVIARSCACERAAQSSSSTSTDATNRWLRNDVGKRAGGGVARFSAGEKRAQRRRLLAFLNGCGLEIVELGEHELLQLRIAARHVNVECRPGLTQKYL